MPLTRLDKILVDRKLVSSRVRAEQIIEEFGVLVEGKLITKTGKKFYDNVEIQLISEEIPWVSKGALKLLAALEHWNIQPNDKVFIDLGASTGGFTEVLISQKAKKVYCVDVGTNQLHPKLRELSQIINLEKTHVRELTNKLIPEMIDGIVVDVSFISLEKVIPFVHPFLKEESPVILLIKPQFEVGKGNLNKHGIVTDTKLYPETIERIKSMCALNQLEFIDFIESPILGGDGNREFLGYFRKMKTT
jgi:23S rRNA (cytidine1920-2'-O)/16S rRNA (cytidine1409-2'-O)-methyltransferase